MNDTQRPDVEAMSQRIHDLEIDLEVAEYLVRKYKRQMLLYQAELWWGPSGKVAAEKFLGDEPQRPVAARRT